MPAVVALLAVGLLTSTTLGARFRPWAPSACDAAAAARAMARAGVTAAPATGAPWFRLDPVMDADGALHGQRLLVGRGPRDPRAVGLDAEAFAAGPFGPIVLAGTDDGAGSRLLALDAATGCASIVDESADVIRRATITPDGGAVVEFRLDRRTRADLGIWRRPLSAGEAVRIVAPLGPDARFGRTWSTELAWSLDGADLAIESCGEMACRTRVLTLATGHVGILDDPDLGTIIGLADGRLVAYRACRGWPCPVVAVTVADGTRQVLAQAAGQATVIATAAGVRLVHEGRVGADRRLTSVALDGTLAQDLGSVPDGLGLAGAVAQVGGEMSIPRGWVLLAPDGRPPLEVSGPTPLLRDALLGRTVALDEVIR